MKLTKENEALVQKIIIFVLIYVLFAKPLIKSVKVALGLAKGAATVNVESEVLKQDSPFKKEFWRAYIYQDGTIANGRKRIDANMFKRLSAVAIQIHDSFGYFYDDENNVLAQIGLIQSQAECSYVSFLFFHNHSIDFLEYLRNGKNILPENGLSDKNLSEIINHINSLKKV